MWANPQETEKSHLLMNSLRENFIFCAVIITAPAPEHLKHFIIDHDVKNTSRKGFIWPTYSQVLTDNQFPIYFLIQFVHISVMVG